MKKGLGKTELTGLILLAILIVGITGCALLLRERSAPKEFHPEPDLKTELLDTLPQNDQAKKRSGKNQKPKTKKTSKKKGSKKKAAPLRKDPFADTIPVD